MSKIDKLIKEIELLSIKLPNNKLVVNYKIYFLLLLILNIEKILLNRKISPIGDALRSLEATKNNFIFLNNIKSFGIKNNFDEKFSKEDIHKKLFQLLWVNFSFDEFKKERLSRYLKRIKINKLKPLLKNKRIIDFGCGHGNFLVSCFLNGSSFGLGIDYGKDSIKYANEIKKKMKISSKNLQFKIATVYDTKEKENSYDFAIQNGVFHHLKYEVKAYKEVYRVLKPGGYLWVYTAGGGGIKDKVSNLCFKILKNLNKEMLFNIIKSVGLTTNKEYYIGDSFNAEYNFRSKESLLSDLKKVGFTSFRQLSGGMKTDFDKPFLKDKYFSEKYGSGDLRFLCQKRIY